MADNKKIKLPQHLQLDSVSPATRLLEKRRLMYEVQKAFEDQKEEYHQKESRFKLQEQELKEKDILIQDNLIKFSTFLQQQEMRKKKDQELTELEKKKISQLDVEIDEKNEQLKIYKEKAEKIERKVESMRKFEKFLEKVKDANPDEFQELIDIHSRYKQLVAKNEELKQKQKQYTDRHEEISRQLAQKENDMSTKQTLINNKMSKQQERLELIDKGKSALLAQRDEKTKEKSKNITETGQVLMTIENLYAKCGAMPDIFPSTKNYKKWEHLKNFDNTPQSGEKAVTQLEIIIQCLENFKKLEKQYNDRLKGEMKHKTAQAPKR